MGGTGEADQRFRRLPTRMTPSTAPSRTATMHKATATRWTCPRNCHDNSSQTMKAHAGIAAAAEHRGPHTSHSAGPASLLRAGPSSRKDGGRHGGTLRASCDSWFIRSRACPAFSRQDRRTFNAFAVVCRWQTNGRRSSAPDPASCRRCRKKVAEEGLAHDGRGGHRRVHHPRPLRTGYEMNSHGHLHVLQVPRTVMSASVRPDAAGIRRRHPRRALGRRPAAHHAVHPRSRLRTRTRTSCWWIPKYSSARGTSPPAQPACPAVYRPMWSMVEAFLTG